MIGCNSPEWGLKEVRSKSKMGPEFRHSGTHNTNKERWAAGTGVEFSFNNGVKTGVTYRRRDDNEGDGNNDNGVWWDMSFPLWKAKDRKMETLQDRIIRLEEEVYSLRTQEIKTELENINKRQVGDKP